MTPPALAGLHVSDAPERWRRLGFTLSADGVELDGVRITLGAHGRGITKWAIHGIRAAGDIDGLPTAVAANPPSRAGSGPPHPNRALGIDHVVVVTPDFDRTAIALERSGMALRRVRDAGGFRQGFRRLGPAILELVEATSMPGGPARFWGLVITVPDLVELGARLAPHLGHPTAAVQSGRRIATLRKSAGVSPKLAFMTPEPELP